MFRFLAKSALATVLFKRYRRTIVSTLLLFACYFFISMIHGDYVSYATSADDRHYLWLSFLLKWVLLISITLVYYFYNVRALGTSPKPPAKAAQQQVQASDAADPFDSIRTKDTLQSRGDVLLKKQTENKTYKK